MSARFPASRTIFFYLAKRFFAAFLLVLASISLIVLLVDFVELLRRAGSKEDVTFQVILQMTIFKFPEPLQKVLPFAVLFAGMLSLWRLTRANELVAARSSGISVWQFLAPSLFVSLLIGGVYVGVVNPIGATMLQRYEQMLDIYVKGQTTSLKIGRSGLWLRQSAGEGHSVIHARSMSTKEMILREVTVYRFDAKHQFTERIDADEAQLAPGAWHMKEALITVPGKRSTRQPALSLKTDWTPDKIKENYSKPETMSFWELPAFIALLDRAGFTATRYRVHWYSQLATPLMFAAMVLIAACFSLRMSRRGGVAILMVSGIMFSFFMFFLTDVVLALGLSDKVPAVLAAGTPVAVAALTGTTILLYSEEG